MRKNFMKKVVAGMLTAVMAFSLTACGGGDASTNDTAKEEGSSDVITVGFCFMWEAYPAKCARGIILNFSPFFILDSVWNWSVIFPDRTGTTLQYNSKGII